MGISKKDIVRTSISFDIEELLLRKEEFISELNMHYLISSEPTISLDFRENEVPHFLGFWVFGDGVEVNVNADSAEVNFSLLLNWKLSPDSYTQLEYDAAFIDRVCRLHYKEYIESNGKITKRIQKRLELLACKSIFDIYQYLNEKDIKIDADVFSKEQLKIIFKQFKMPKRYSY